MNKIEKLIQEFCPDGVEYYELGDIGKITIGEFVHKSRQSENGRYPVYNGGTTNTGLYDDFNNTSNKIVVSARGANAGYVNKVLVDYWAGNSCYSISFIDNFKIDWIFVYYYLKQNEHKLIGDQQKGGIPAISKKMIERFKIPVPPLPVQQEIVNILDKFTQLDEELNAELEIRRIQYDCYLNQLMGFKDSEVEWKTLGEVAELKAGKSISATDISDVEDEEFKFKCIGGNGIRGYVKESSNFGDFPIIGRQGALCGNLFYATGKFYATEHAVVVKSMGLLNQRFLYYLLNYMNLNQYSTGGAQPGLAVRTLNKILIPIPYLSEQERIVSILDKFDALVNDSKISIPAEIEARRKQYAYYRNKLLTFGEYA